MFKALVVEKNEDGKTSATVQELSLDQLPAGDVTVAVDLSLIHI